MVLCICHLRRGVGETMRFPMWTLGLKSWLGLVMLLHNYALLGAGYSTMQGSLWASRPQG